MPTKYTAPEQCYPSYWEMHSPSTSCKALLASRSFNPGKKEFANRLLLVGATRTKRFENLAFAPFPNYSRFLQINKSKAIRKRKKEEERMQSSFKIYKGSISNC